VQRLVQERHCDHEHEYEDGAEAERQRHTGRTGASARTKADRRLF
jgi:hypothetical protein